jgi:hypothetical protein
MINTNKYKERTKDVLATFSNLPRFLLAWNIKT